MIDWNKYLSKRQADIVNAVIILADKFGTAGITTKNISKFIGFQESAIYKYFKSKQEIFNTIINCMHSEFINIFENVNNLNLSYEKKLEKLMTLFLSILNDFPGINRLIFSDEIHIYYTDTFELFINFLNKMKDKISTLIEKGIKNKEFLPTLDINITALHYLGLIHIAFDYWNYFTKRQANLIEIGNRLFKQFKLILKSKKGEQKNA